MFVNEDPAVWKITSKTLNSSWWSQDFVDFHIQMSSFFLTLKILLSHDNNQSVNTGIIDKILVLLFHEAWCFFSENYANVLNLKY